MGKWNNIVLVGFMGTGKTTVARLLADRMGWNMVDTDDWIVEREKRTIPEIFAKEGEPYFRQVESEAIREIMAQTRQIVSTGGGAVLLEKNRRLMLQNGFIVALKADMQTIIERVSKDENRPLLHGNLEERVRLLLEERKTAYDFADIQIDTSFKTAQEVAETILKQRERFSASQGTS